MIEKRCDAAKQQNQISVFDMDGTLTHGDTFTGFIRHVYGLGGLFRVLLTSSIPILLWKLGFRDNTYAKIKMFSAAFKGMRYEDFKRYGETYSPKIDRMLRASTISALNEARERGDLILIDSASVREWLEPWGMNHGVHSVIATEAEVDTDGLLTGRFSSPNCQYEEKIRRLEEYLPELKSRRDAYYIRAWGDSPSDLPLLTYSDEPHPV